MPEKEFSSSPSSTDRYVPSHSSHRVGRFFRAVLILLSFVFAPQLIAEESAGSAAELSREVELRSAPGTDSAVIGKLPRGTVLMLTGAKEDGFEEVEVELQTGSASGWVPAGVARTKSHAEDTGDMLEVERVRRKKAVKPQVPQDEALLLRREPSFFYGIHAEGVLAIMEVEPIPGYVTGPGFSAGGQIGMFINRKLPVSAEVAYTVVTGVGGTGEAVGFGMMDIGVKVAYLISRFELFGGLRYSIGVGILDLPSSVQLVSAADISSLWIQGGVGYRIMAGETTDIILRAKYGLSLNRAPVGMQTLGLAAFLELRG